MRYYHRFNLSLTLPTGQCSPNSAINLGNHLVSIDPYYAVIIIAANGRTRNNRRTRLIFPKLFSGGYRMTVTRKLD